MLVTNIYFNFYIYNVNKRNIVPGYKYNVDLERCYKFHLNPLTWRDAVEACDAEEATLATLNSKLEADHLVNITADAPKDKVQGSYLSGAVHLGFYYDQTQKSWRTFTGMFFQNRCFKYYFIQYSQNFLIVDIK